VDNVDNETSIGLFDYIDSHCSHLRLLSQLMALNKIARLWW